jgi:hypothetical protein
MTDNIGEDVFKFGMAGQIRTDKSYGPVILYRTQHVGTNPFIGSIPNRMVNPSSRAKATAPAASAVYFEQENIAEFSFRGKKDRHGNGALG